MGSPGRRGRSARPGLRGRRERPVPPALAPSKIAFDAPANTPTATILTFGGLILRAACSSAGDMSVSARSTLDNARLHVAGVDDTGAFYREDDDLDAGSDSDVLGSDDDDVAGTIVYRTPTGSGTVSVSFLGEEFSIAGVARCQFAGTAVSAQSGCAGARSAEPCTKRTKALISRAPNTQGGDAVPGRLKLAITLALAGLIVGATPVLASTGSHGQTPMAGYTGKVQNRVLSDTSAGGNSSFIVELKQQADLSKAYSMKNQDARGWYVYRTLKQTAEQTQGPLKAMLDQQGVSYRSFWVANELVVHSGGRALVDSLAAGPTSR